MTMIARPHGPILPEGLSAWAMAHSLLVWHVRIMQDNCPSVPVQASCHME